MLARILRGPSMPSGDSRGPLRASHAAIALMAVMCGWAASGCVALVVGAAGGVAGAVYVMGKLTDELPYDVPTVHQATLSALKDLDLTPLEDRVDKLSAHVESAFADGEHVWIDLDTVMDAHTSLAIRVGLTGNEVRARRIHDAIKRHVQQDSTRS